MNILQESKEAIVVFIIDFPFSSFRVDILFNTAVHFLLEHISASPVWSSFSSDRELNLMLIHLHLLQLVYIYCADTMLKENNLMAWEIQHTLTKSGFCSEIIKKVSTFACLHHFSIDIEERWFKWLGGGKCRPVPTSVGRTLQSIMHNDESTK